MLKSCLTLFIFFLNEWMLYFHVDYNLCFYKKSWLERVA